MSKRSRSHSSILESNSEELRRSASVPGAARETVKPVTEADRKRAKEKQSRIYIIAVVSISLLLAVFILFRGVIFTNEQLTSELVVPETGFSSLVSDAPDGVYAGSYSTAHMSAGVSIDVASGRVRAIRLDSYSGIDPRRAQSVFEDMVEYQQLSVPELESASEHTDKIVGLAVLDALENAAKYAIENGYYQSSAVSDSGA